jgi:Flp pilus assembly pilin Flp
MGRGVITMTWLTRIRCDEHGAVAAEYALLLAVLSLGIAVGASNVGAAVTDAIMGIADKIAWTYGGDS